MNSVTVPFFDWAGFFNERKDEFSRIMIETASRGGFILQKDVEDFEILFALIEFHHYSFLSIFIE